MFDLQVNSSFWRSNFSLNSCPMAVLLLNFLSSQNVVLVLRAAMVRSMRYGNLSGCTFKIKGRSELEDFQKSLVQ